MLPLGVDTHLFTSEGRPDRPSRPAVVLYVGRVAEWKGVHLLVDAIARISDRAPGAVLRIVGPTPDPAYRAQLEDAARRHGIADRVVFDGEVGRSDLPAVYRAASVLVLPSVGEGFGMVVAEALACGTPAIARLDGGGPAEQITDGVDGRLVAGGRRSGVGDRRRPRRSSLGSDVGGRPLDRRRSPRRRGHRSRYRRDRRLGLQGQASGRRP